MNESQLVAKIEQCFNYCVIPPPSYLTHISARMVSLELINATLIYFHEQSKSNLVAHIYLNRECSKHYLINLNGNLLFDLIKNNLIFFNKLESFGYISYVVDIKYDFLVDAPPNLKALTIDHLKNLNSNFTKNIEAIRLPLRSHYFICRDILSDCKNIEVNKKNFENILKEIGFDPGIHKSIKVLHILNFNGDYIDINLQNMIISIVKI